MDEKDGASGDPLRGLGDKALGRAVDAVPDGPLKQALKQAGWVGLALGVLIGNIPVSTAAATVAKNSAPLDLDKIEIYFRVFVLFTPWVLLLGAITYTVVSESRPQASAYGYLYGAVIVFMIGVPISQTIGGLVPLEAAGGPKSGGPGLVQYLSDSAVAYIKLYGPAALLAGLVEGCAFGYWVALLNGTLPQAAVGVPAPQGPVMRRSTPAAAPTSSPEPASTSSPEPASTSTPEPSPPDEEWNHSSTYRSGARVNFRGAPFAVKHGRASARGVPPPNDSANWRRP